MASVEEMLEGYEWASDDILGGARSKGAVDQIAARLLDELMALDKVTWVVAVNGVIDATVYSQRQTSIPSSNPMIAWQRS